MRNNTPRNYQKTIQYTEKDLWIETIKAKFDLLQVNKTWELIKLPQSQKVVFGQWVYKKKYGPLGAIKHYKAYRVVKDFHKIKNIDYNKTFVSIIKSIIWKMLFTLWIKYHYCVHWIPYERNCIGWAA